MTALSRALAYCQTDAQRASVRAVLDVLPNTCQPRQRRGAPGTVLLYWLPATVREDWHVLVTVEEDGTVQYSPGPMRGWMTAPAGQDPLDRVLSEALAELERRGVKV